MKDRDPLMEALNDAFVFGEQHANRPKLLTNQQIDEKLKEIKERYFF